MLGFVIQLELLPALAQCAALGTEAAGMGTARCSQQDERGSRGELGRAEAGRGVQGAWFSCAGTEGWQWELRQRARWEMSEQANLIWHAALL